MKPLRVHGLPLHPMLVHFPVAAWSVATGLALLSLFSTDDELRGIAFHANAFGVISGAIAMLAGLLELAGLPDNPALRDTVARHLTLAASAWLVYGVMLVLQIKGQLEISAIAGTIGMALLVAAGHAGARVVYHHGYPSKTDT